MPQPTDSSKQQIPIPSDVRVYETTSGLKFWADNKFERCTLKAPTIRTTDPEISIVFVRNDVSYEQSRLFVYNGKKFAFSIYSPRAHAYVDTYDKLKERNPNLDIIFHRVGDTTVFWHDGFAKLVGTEFEAEEFTIDADNDFGARREFEDMTSLFFELNAWTLLGTWGMARGPDPSLNFEFKPARAGLDKAFLKSLNFAGNSSG